MRDAAMTGSPRTTLGAGLALGVAAIIELFAAGDAAIPVTPDYAVVVGFSGPLLIALATLLLVAGALILALGRGGEAGLLRRSRAAGTALLIWAAADAALVISSLARQVVVTADADLVPGTGWGTPLLALAGALALATVAVAAVRRRLLEAVARGALVVAAAAPLLGTLLTSIPIPEGALEPVSPLLSVLPWISGLAALAFAVGLLIHGRTAALGERLRTIRRAW